MSVQLPFITQPKHPVYLLAKHARPKRGRRGKNKTFHGRSRTNENYDVKIKKVCDRLIREGRPKTLPPEIYDDSAERAAAEAARQRELSDAKDRMKVLNCSTTGPRRSISDYEAVGEK